MGEMTEASSATSTDHRPRRYRVVLRRGRTEFLQGLQEQFPDELHLVRVIWDRRIQDRRVTARTVEVERRRGERRQTPALTWDTFGFVRALQLPESGAARAAQSSSRLP
jgi:hypothetical protein